MLPRVDPLSTNLSWVERCLLAESCRTTPIPTGPSYEAEILAALPGGMSLWWRPPQFRFDADLDFELGVSQLADALSQHRELPKGGRVLVSGIDRQLMARAALRLGAWNLLSVLVRTQLRESRSACPTAYRLSRATGLVAEWALASGQPDIAIVYIDESLTHGTEQHRMRSYLGYANVLQNRSHFSPLDDIPFLLSIEATRRQVALGNRHMFSLLHAVRLRCLSLLNNDCSPSQSELARVQSDYALLIEQAQPGSSPRFLATLAVTVALPAGTISIAPGDLEAAIDFLFGAGRWRDLQLLHLTDPTRFPRLPPRAVAFIRQMDQLGHVWTSQMPVAGPVDRELLAALPTGIQTANAREAQRRMLCCI